MAEKSEIVASGPPSTAGEAEPGNDVHAALLDAVAHAATPTDALDAAARIAAVAVAAECCAIYMRQSDNGLEPRACSGPGAEFLTADNERRLLTASLDRVEPQQLKGAAFAIAVVPVVAINQAIGAVVVRRKSASPFTIEELMRLSGIASELVELLESVRLRDVIAREGRSGRQAELIPEFRPPTEERLLSGVAVSPGIAIGVVTFRNYVPRTLVRYDTTRQKSSSEATCLRDALQKTRNDLLRLQAAAAMELGEDHALIFVAHLLLLSDVLFTDLVEERTASGQSASLAVDGAFDEIVARLRAVDDPYLQERVEDLEDLRSRILDYLINGNDGADLQARVVVCRRTAPSLVIELKARGALGIASELGGPTSHGALLARAIGVPAVSGITGLGQEVFADDLLIVDGNKGLVIVRPTSATQAEYEARRLASERRQTEFLRFRNVHAMTADGTRVELQANVALGADIALARDNGAEGIGLYRTEFPFIVRDAVPSVPEQVKIYARAYHAFPTAPVTFRLLDLAGDKFLSRAGLGLPQQVFHGYRAIRVLFDYPHLLRDQVQAIAIGAAGRTIRLLIPMVTCLEEVIRIKQMVADALTLLPGETVTGPIVYGAMVETPAAVEIVGELAEQVDFFSIGTNDLIQYTLVVDRDDPRLNLERHAYHPAILRMIRRVVQAAQARRKPVTVCGEMAVRPEFAMAMLAIGIDSLSVTPKFIPEVKQALANVAVEPLRARLDELFTLATAAEVEAYLRRYVANDPSFR